MNNAGYEDVRQKVADYLNRTSGLSSISSQHIIMTCGAAGALNVVLKTLLTPEKKSSYWHLTLQSIYSMWKITAEKWL